MKAPINSGLTRDRDPGYDPKAFSQRLARDSELSLQYSASPDG
jgi:hypothetical protein